jgi:benzoyl-CoA reductase/2-hydroxyglutaryl-CoA dehydratase subunit BcrC/BadD/HgdB
MVIGNYINDHDFWKIFTDAGIRVISGDLCVGSRYFNFEVDLSRLDRITDNKESGSLLNAGMPKNNADNSGLIFRMIAENYLKKPLCFRMTSLDEKIKSTTEKIKAGNIKAVIFTSLKFCDNTLYFYPALKSELSKLDIPSLYLDIEYGKSSHGQLSTRIEAFCEMLF